MNDQQRKAVFKIKGPLLILAGAGSGKTTVLVNRIANMIYFGNAYNTEQTYGTPSEQDIQFLKDYIDGKTNDASTLADIVAYDCSTGVLLLFVSVFSTYEALVYPYS